MVAVFKPEEPSPPLTPEREAVRQLLNDEERKMLEAMERDLGRPLTEEEEHLVLEPGALIEQPSPKISSPMRPSGGRGSRQNEARRNMVSPNHGSSPRCALRVHARVGATPDTRQALVHGYADAVS
jgi:hypothetical protein